MQRLDKPRLAPLKLSEIDPELREEFFPNQSYDHALNINKTLARHPLLYKKWLSFAEYILSEQSLPPRDRELLILRIGWLCQAPYEWRAHTYLAKTVGLKSEEIERIKQGPAADGWSWLDKILLTAVDELHSNAIISDTTWESLSKSYDERQMMDLIVTVGQYNLVCMMLNSLGVPIDENLFPA
jgi:4-carboxymuconolactone decarboxylase